MSKYEHQIYEVNNIINISPGKCDILHNLYESIGEEQEQRREKLKGFKVPSVNAKK